MRDRTNLIAVGTNIWTGRYVAISTSSGIYSGLASINIKTFSQQ